MDRQYKLHVFALEYYYYLRSTERNVMCCFSGRVKRVFNTRIFGRAEDAVRQFLVYSMSLSTAADVAMVLPLPVRVGTGEKGVNFISLKEYPEFFSDLELGFSPPPGPAPGAKPSRGVMQSALEVVRVGNFEASFVPTVADFPRLDERFRLPEGTWEKLPTYRSYGFAVFKLKPGNAKIHPMAFSFPRADVSSLFFPTVHIHDGQVHDAARFDHVLYCQRSPGDKTVLKDWRESAKLARDYVKIEKASGLIAGEEHCFRKELIGTLPNRDTFLM